MHISGRCFNKRKGYYIYCRCQKYRGLGSIYFFIVKIYRVSNVTKIHVGLGHRTLLRYVSLQAILYSTETPLSVNLMELIHVQPLILDIQRTGFQQYRKRAPKSN